MKSFKEEFSGQPKDELKAKHIWETYIQLRSPLEINIDASIRESINEKLPSTICLFVCWLVGWTLKKKKKNWSRSNHGKTL